MCFRIAYLFTTDAAAVSVLLSRLVVFWIKMDAQEHNFRTGMVTALAWATKVAGQMAREGKPPPEIVDVLYELLDVALDYEEGRSRCRPASLGSGVATILSTTSPGEKASGPKAEASGQARRPPHSEWPYYWLVTYFAG